MVRRKAALLAAACCLCPLASFGQSSSGKIPAGTPLTLQIDQHYPMRVGQQIRAHLMYPIYADNELRLPKSTVVDGTVIGLESNHDRRVRAALGGDFTPFYTPEVRFDHFVLEDGTTVPVQCGTAANGTQIYRAVSPTPAKGGLIVQQFNAGLNAARSDLATFIAPGKADRLLQFIYGRLPYHPQRIEKGTSWTVETQAAVDIPEQPAHASAASESAPRRLHFWDEQPPAPTAAPEAGTWIVQAELSQALSSESSKPGQPIKAVVAEPIYTADHTLAVPQGATLVGTVTRAKPARMFGRTGVLSFNFSQLVLPDAPTETVETRLTGADSAQDIALNSEGQAKSKPKDKLTIPLMLALMASRPLDQDEGHASNTAGKNGVGGAAGLGLVGTILGVAGGSPYVAAGIGYWGAAQAVYRRWIGRGQKITFAKNTRIVLETTPRRSAPIK